MEIGIFEILGILAILNLWLLWGLASGIVASNRGKNLVLWFMIGLLLGPIGFALAYTRGKRCRDCASTLSINAHTCPHCWSPLDHHFRTEADALREIRRGAVVRPIDRSDSVD